MNGERRKKYPKHWELIAKTCKEKAGWRCGSCLVKQHEERISKRTGLTYPVYLHAAHADHDPDNPDPRLICLCPTCHAIFDSDFRVRQRRIALEKMRHRKRLAIARK